MDWTGPLPEQFLRYVTDLAHFRLGRSLQTGNDVRDDLARYLPATLELVLLGMGFACTAGISAGILSAVRRHSWSDHLVRIVAVCGVALPAFWIALLMQLVFAVHLGWLPTGGQLSVAADPPPVITGMELLDALLSGQWGTLRRPPPHTSCCRPSCCPCPVSPPSCGSTVRK